MIAIIGNDYPDKFYSASSFVDNCEIVIRFNITPHYNTGMIGSKTDILVIRTGHDTGKGLAIMTGKFPLISEVYQQAKEYWFVSNKGREQCQKFYNLEGKLINIRNKLLKNKLGSSPSTGIVAIDYILTNDLYAEHDKYLVASGWKQLKNQYKHKQHNWDNEIKYIQKHIEMGNLKRWEPMILL